MDARERARARARQHLDRALYLAGLAQDPSLTLRVWNSVSMLAHQQGDHAEALAAGQAAKATAVTRRDPLYASLAHARTAIAHAHLDEGRQALRALDLAAASLDKADLALPRPSWIRMRSLLGDFHRDLLTLAPGSAIALDWADRYRTEWSRP
ncbi:hypothetical protein [Streptomyces venezuelae]|uniref:hypothetical protein n=1 Tax=Streptomyces venezuelae TaxID=54571 RepID=UPI00168D19DD|nr:hypothetical protein [Streptomyces venezuelae]